MSKDALAGVYTVMLEDDSFRDGLADNPAQLDDWDLDDEEKAALLEEARAEVSGFAFGSGPVMSHMSSRRGASLTPSVASRLGQAMNQNAGLPGGALNGPGFLSNAACCPWGHGSVPGLGGQL